jgi:hypothetical protein
MVKPMRMSPGWARLWRALVVAVLMIAASSAPARAQATPVWPELDAYVRLNDRIRFFFLATTVQENRESTEGEFGGNVDFYLKPIRRRRPALEFRLDESKNRMLMLRTGYRYLPSYTGGAAENRGVVEATARTPLIGLVGDVLLSDRNRVDIRDIEGDVSWRYRNRLSAEREMSLGPVRINPYARFEVFYDSRYDRWSRTEWMLGASFPFVGRWEMETYYDDQHDSSVSPSRHSQALGIAISLYLRP